MSPSRIRVHNYSLAETEEPDALRPPGDRFFYGIIGIGVFAFFFLTYPYRDITVPSPILAFLGLASMMALIGFSWLRPQYYIASIAFCVYIPFSGAYPGDFGKQILGINFTNFLLVPLLLQWLMQRSYLREPLVKIHSPDFPVLIFLILSTMSLFTLGLRGGEINFATEFVRVKRWITPFIVYFLFVNMARNEKGIQYIVVAICTNLTAIAILTMKDSYDIGTGGTWDEIRVSGVLGEPNGMGAFFVYYTLLFLGFFLCNMRDRRYWLLLIPFLLCSRAMTLTNSRGGLIAFALAMLATLLVRSRVLFLIGVAAIWLGITYPQYLPETISGRLIYGTLRPLAQTGDSESSRAPIDTDEVGMAERLDASAAGRLAIWKAGWQLFLEAPWFGHGYGEFPRQVGRFNPAVHMRDPHNSYLGIAVEMGAFALFAFVVAVLSILRCCFSVYRYSPDPFIRSLGLAGVGMIMGLLSANMFGSRLDTVELTAYFWIVSGVIVQYHHDMTRRIRTDGLSERRLVIDPWAREEEMGEEEEEEEEEEGEEEERWRW